MNLIERAKNVVVTPRSEWQVIAPETSSAGDLYRGYAVPLAAIGPVAQFIGISLIGISVPFLGTIRLPFTWALTQSILQYALSLIGIYVISLIINGLAPSFGGQKNPLQALKVAVYAFTPAWLAGVLHIVPALSILVLLASLYGLYVLYLGLPVLMQAPEDKAAGYTAVVVVCAIVVMAIIGLVAGAVGSMGISASRLAAGGGSPFAHTESGVPPLGDGKMGQMAAQLQASAEQMEAAQKSGNAEAQAAAAANALGALARAGGQPVEPVDQNILKSMLPDTAGGLPRTSVEASRGGMAGMQVAMAKASYGNGQGSNIDVEITDIGSAHALGAAAAWASVEQSRETDTGYEKTGKVNGIPVHEVFDRRSAHGTYSTLVGERFLVDANGSNVDMDALKQTVAAMDLAKLDAMKSVGVK